MINANIKKALVVIFIFLMHIQFVNAQSRSGGAGSALDWHSWSSRPQWVKNLDEYDWQYVFNAPYATMSINPSSVPRNVMELIDRDFGRGANGQVWAYSADDSNVIKIYMRTNGTYLWISVSRYWFN